MDYIISLAIIVFVIISALALAKGTSFFAFLADSVDYIKRLFSKAPAMHNRKESNQSQSQGTIGLSGKGKEKQTNLSFVGMTAKQGTQTQLSVFDHSGGLIGTKTVFIDDIPLLIGRGTDIEGYHSKLCLPDITDGPTTSRTHCILVNNKGKLMLKDCYDKASAFDEAGKQIHSVSKIFQSDEYVGDGFIIDRGGKAEVDIGDYVLEINNLSRISPRNVPTYGYGKVSSTPTRDVSGSGALHVPTKEFKIR